MNRAMAHNLTFETMSDDLKPKMEVPNRLGLAVLVCEVQTGGKLIPLTRYERPDGEGLRISHGAHKAVLGLDVLREATLLCLHACGLPAETVPGSAGRDGVTSDESDESDKSDRSDGADGDAWSKGGAV
jgi:hypothetical protein